MTDVITEDAVSHLDRSSSFVSKLVASLVIDELMRVREECNSILDMKDENAGVLSEAKSDLIATEVSIDAMMAAISQTGYAAKS